MAFQFPALLSVFPWQAIGTPLCPLPNQALHGSWAGSPGELDSHVRRAGLFLPVSCVMRQCDHALPGSGPGPAWTCFHAQVPEPATILSPSTPTPIRIPSRMEEPISPLMEGKQPQLRLEILHVPLNWLVSPCLCICLWDRFS